MKFRDCCFIVVAVVAVVIGSSEVRQTQESFASEVNQVDPPPIPVTTLEVEDSDDCQCPCECDECLCAFGPSILSGSDCKDGVCDPSSAKIVTSTGSCSGGSCAAGQPVRNTVQSTTRRVFRSGGTGPIRRVLQVFRLR